MKKNKLLSLTKILYAVFMIYTIVVLAMTYGNVDGPYVGKIAMGYMVLVAIMLIYVPSVTIFNSKKIKKETRILLVKKFIIMFSGLFLLNIVIGYFTKDGIDLLRAGSHALGLSFGLAFLSVTFHNKKAI